MEYKVHNKPHLIEIMFFSTFVRYMSIRYVLAGCFIVLVLTFIITGLFDLSILLSPFLFVFTYVLVELMFQFVTFVNLILGKKMFLSDVDVLFTQEGLKAERKEYSSFVKYGMVKRAYLFSNYLFLNFKFPIKSGFIKLEDTENREELLKFLEMKFQIKKLFI